MSASAKHLRPQNSNRTLFFTESEVFLDGVDISRRNPRNNFFKAQITPGRSSDRELDTIQSLVQKIDENYIETSIFDKLK